MLPTYEELLNDDAKPNLEQDQYCVICPTVDSTGARRTWRRTLSEGVEHAKNLLRKKPYSHRYTTNNAGKELLVVKVVARIKLSEPKPPVTVTVFDDRGSTTRTE